VFTDCSQVKDQLIKLELSVRIPQLQLRLIQVRFGSTWYSYLTSVLDPQQLPPFAVADLYCRRWRIEEAFCTVKRLLGPVISGQVPLMGEAADLGYLVILCRASRPGRCRR